MSQDAKMRDVIDDAVQRATAPLAARLEALEARLAADQGPVRDKAAPAAAKPQTGRSARSQTAQGGKAAAGANESDDAGR